MDHEQSLFSLWNELEAMPEHQTLEKIRHFGVSLEIFNGNYNELIHHLQIHNDPKVSLRLMSVDNRRLLFAYQKEITRFLHNYIASALSLTDHARNHYRELYSNNQLFPDYQPEIDKRFKNNPLAVFIKDLRQYFQHYKMPGLSTNMYQKNNTSNLQITLRLPTEAMLKFSGWNSLSKKFLLEQKKDIDLLTLINDYHNLIQEFYTWFISRQKEIHNDDIKKVNEHKAKIRSLEVSNFLMQFIKQPKSLMEFETAIFRLFPEDELKEIKDSVTIADRVEKILQLIKRTKEIDNLTENKIKTVYNT